MKADGDAHPDSYDKLLAAFQVKSADINGLKRYQHLRFIALKAVYYFAESH